MRCLLSFVGTWSSQVVLFRPDPGWLLNNVWSALTDIVLLPPMPAQPGQEAGARVPCPFRSRWQAQEYERGWWFLKQVLHLKCREHHVPFLGCHQDDTVTLLIVHQQCETLQHITGEDLIAFNQDRVPCSLPFDRLQEVLGLLDMLKTRSAPP